MKTATLSTSFLSIFLTWSDVSVAEPGESPDPIEEAVRSELLEEGLTGRDPVEVLEGRKPGRLGQFRKYIIEAWGATRVIQGADDPRIHCESVVFHDRGRKRDIMSFYWNGGRLGKIHFYGDPEVTERVARSYLLNTGGGTWDVMSVSAFGSTYRRRDGATAELRDGSLTIEAPGFRAYWEERKREDEVAKAEGE